MIWIENHTKFRENSKISSWLKNNVVTVLFTIFSLLGTSCDSSIQKPIVDKVNTFNKLVNVKDWKRYITVGNTSYPITIKNWAEYMQYCDGKEYHLNNVVIISEDGNKKLVPIWENWWEYINLITGEKIQWNPFFIYNPSAGQVETNKVEIEDNTGR